ncbi:MAG: T9SS type A sorting domain-containing protein [Spirosoma sp.]|nr:T9SS type A sorting domain-containing protein [Spirosoma sp.]
MKTKLSLLLGLLLIARLTHASHLRGGYIQVRSTTALTYEINVYVFGDELSGSGAISATNSVLLCLGDGTTLDVPRLSRVFSPNKTTSISTYRTTYTYAGPGTYTVSTSQGNRTGVLNIPGATNFTMVLTTTFVTGNVQTPTLSIPENGFTAPLNQRYVLPFGSSDFTGDSLSYSLAKPLVSQSSNNCAGTAALATIRLTDLNGRILHELVFKQAARQHEQVISLSGVSSGVYLLRADVGGRLLVQKVVKK